MLSERLLIRFGEVTIELSGWLPERDECDFVNLFIIDEGTPDIRVQVTRVSAITLPDAEPERVSFGKDFYDLGARQVISFLNFDSTGFWPYAALNVKKSEPNLLALQVLDHGCTFTVRGILGCIGIESLLHRRGAAILHASCIDVDGQAVLFSAPSGTGKSTQAALWERLRGVEVINGDKILLQQRSGTLMAYGLPYAGTSNISKNRTLPVRCVVMLSQAKENRLERMAQLPAVKALLGQISAQYWNPEDVQAAMEAAVMITQSVPVYSFACLPDVSAVETLEAEIRPRT